jgi:hypothetical protein
MMAATQRDTFFVEEETNFLGGNSTDRKRDDTSPIMRIERAEHTSIRAPRRAR